MINDSTLRVKSFADSTLAVVDDTTSYSLRGGRFTNYDRPRRYVAKAIDATQIEFIPVNATNGFIWRKGDENSWQAIIAAPATATHAPIQRNHIMTRYKK